MDKGRCKDLRKSDKCLGIRIKLLPLRNGFKWKGKKWKGR